MNFLYICTLLFYLLFGQMAWSLDRDWFDETETSNIEASTERLKKAIENPEYMLKNWIGLPSWPKSNKKLHYLTLEDAILLALRYNPNIQNAQLDRVVARYQLRLAHNEFEMQYALAGTGFIEKTHYSNVGSTTNKTGLVAPELSYKSPFGTRLSLRLDNNVSAVGNYNPLLNFQISQPLLRGFGRDVNEINFFNALDTELLNQLNLKQAIINQITGVITSYRALIVSGNHLKIQQKQLDDARKTFKVNEERIKAGLLEPTGNIQQSYQIESLSLMVEQAENQFRISAVELLQSLGLPSEIKLAIPTDVSIVDVKIPNKKAAIKAALDNNPQYLGLKSMLKADERALKAAENLQLWQLDLTTNFQTGLINNVDNPTATGIYNGRSHVESAGVTLTIPLRDLNRKNQLISAKIRLEKDKINLLAAKRFIITTITNILANIESLAKRQLLAQHQVLLAQKSYDLEKKKMGSGISSVLDVNNTQNHLLQAQMGLISAKVAYLNELSLLEKTLGTTLENWQINLR